MTLAQLAKEIRSMVAAEIDAPENEEEREELQAIVDRFSDKAVIDWWLCCSKCGGPLVAWAVAEAFIKVSEEQEHFDALVECMAELTHVDHSPCPTAYAHYDWRHPRA